MQGGWKLSEYEANILGGRKAIPKMLVLFKKQGIHIAGSFVVQKRKNLPRNTLKSMGFTIAEQTKIQVSYRFPRQLKSWNLVQIESQ